MNRSERSARTDGDATRARILEAAGRLFADVGYAETTNKAIAQKADVDVASINYHFGSRNALYQAVLVAAHRYFIDLDTLKKVANSSLSEEDKLGSLIEVLIQGSSGNENWHACVMFRELLAPSTHLRTLFQEEAQPKLQIIINIMSEITGIPQDDPALIRCLLNVAAPMMMLVVVRTVPSPFQGFFNKSQDDIKSHLQNFTMAGLKEISRLYHSG